MRPSDTTSVAFIRTDDGFLTNATLIPGGAHFAALSGFVFVEVERPTQNVIDVDLYVSTDGASFSEARFDRDLTETGYYILDASEGAAFVHVMTARRTGDILRSDGSGLRYALTLRGNMREDYAGAVDFMKVRP
jgi:hypothetical protein